MTLLQPCHTLPGIVDTLTLKSAVAQETRTLAPTQQADAVAHHVVERVQGQRLHAGVARRAAQEEHGALDRDDKQAQAYTVQNGAERGCRRSCGVTAAPSKACCRNRILSQLASGLQCLPLLTT
jgi:hypothetical protein